MSKNKKEKKPQKLSKNKIDKIELLYKKSVKKSFYQFQKTFQKLGSSSQLKNA